MSNFLHEHKDYADLIKIIADEKGIEPGLVEKDYWIMHVLYGLKQQAFNFELKGGTSLSKGYKIIHRFSEDIDIHIKPPEKFCINENPKNTNKNNAEKRKLFYDWLATEIILE
jgi:predicted nucleotidyltransferase component of viral defense system